MDLVRSLFFLLLMFTLAACGGDGGSGGGGGGGETTESEDTDFPGTPEGGTSGGSGGGGGGGGVSGSRPARLVYDDDMTAAEVAALDESTEAMGALAVDGSRIPRFSQIFGGNRSSDVVDFFEDRINFALSATTDIQDRLILGADTLATNIGTKLWVQGVLDGSPVRIEIDGVERTVNSSRTGILQFGAAFLQVEKVFQTSVLVHEARHSDCTGGLSRTDVESFLSTGIPPRSLTCGHPHAICPAGHSLAGEFACDINPWGPYAIQAFYAEAVASACASCSATDRSVADAVVFDSLTRLLYSIEDLIEGDLGNPDMSSSSTVRE